MAARNPTAYTTWIDESLLTPGEPVLAATPDAVLNDQVFVLDQPTIITSWVGHPMSEQGSSYQDKVTFYASSRDMCDVSTVTNNEIACDFYAFVWKTTVAGAGNFKITSTATANNTSVATLATGGTGAGIPVWIQGDTLNIKTNGNEDTLTLAIQVTADSGTATLYIQSLLLIARGT